MKNKILTYIINLSIVTFYLIILILGFYPKVPIEYKLYYIDKVLLEWPGYNGLEYDLGKKQYFYGDNAPKNMGKGWSNRENWGMWSDGEESTLYYKVTSLDKNILFSMGTVNKYSELAAYVNDKSIPNSSIKFENNVYTFVIPKEYLESSGLLKVTFKFKDVKSPYEKGESVDKRKLGIGLIWTQVDLVN